MNDRLKFPQNFRLLKILALVSVMVLTACDKDDPQHFIDEGKALFDKGDMESARVQFRNALQINPRLAEAYYGLALLDEKKPDWQAMRQDLQEVVTLDPNHLDAHVKLGFLLINELDKAKEQAGIALKLDPENSGAILLDGRIKFHEDNKTEALRQVERVLAKDARNAEAIWLQTTIFIGDKRYDEALAALSQGIAAHPDDLALGMLKVTLHKAQLMPDEVIRDYEELIEKHPEDKTLRYARLEMLARIGKPEQVEQALRVAIGEDPADIQLKLSLVDYVERRDATRAESLLKEFIEPNPKEVKLKGRLAGFYIGHKRYPEAQSLLQEMVAADPAGKDGLTAKLRMAELAWAQNDKALAQTLAEEIINVDGGNSGALLFRANTRLSKQDIDGAVSDLRIVLRDQPNSDRAMVMMAQAYALKGEPEVAESHWRKALEVNPGKADAVIPLVTGLLKRGDHARAEELLVKSLKASPNNPAVLELLVKARAAKKDWAGAEAAAAELKKMPQVVVVGQLLSGMLAASQGRHLEAIQAYKEVLSQKPDAAEPMVAMARSYEAAGRRAEFFTFLRDFLNEHPSSIIAHNALGMAYVAEKKWVDAAKTLQEALKLDPKSIVSYKLLAGVLTQQGKTDDIADLYRKGLAVSPDNPELMMELAKYHELVKDFGAAITAYNDLLEKFPGNDEAANNLADLLVNSNADSEGLERARALVGRFKDSPNPYFLDTYGWVLFKSGDVENAVTVLKKATAAAPEIAVLRYHLGEAYHGAGEHGASKVELEKSLSLAKRAGEFAGIDRAKELLKQIGKPTGA